MRVAHTCLAVITAMTGTLLIGGVASAASPQAAAPPIWSQPRFSVHWENMQFFFDDQGTLVYALADLVDAAGNSVGTVKDTYHADFEDWEYTYYWPGTTEPAGSFRIPRATSDPHPSTNRATPGPAAELYHFVGEVTEASGVFGTDGLVPMIGALVEMRAEVGRDGSFSCICTITRPAGPARGRSRPS